MTIDAGLSTFIDGVQRDHPATAGEDLPAYAKRYAAMSARLPAVVVPVEAGDFRHAGHA